MSIKPRRHYLLYNGFPETRNIQALKRKHISRLPRSDPLIICLLIPFQTVRICVSFLVSNILSGIIPLQASQRAWWHVFMDSCHNFLYQSERQSSEEGRMVCRGRPDTVVAPFLPAATDT